MAEHRLLKPWDWVPVAGLATCRYRHRNCCGELRERELRQLERWERYQATAFLITTVSAASYAADLLIKYFGN